MRRLRWVAVVAAALVGWSCGCVPGRTHGGRSAGGTVAAAPRSEAAGHVQTSRRVILIVVDGLDARDVRPDETPALARAWHESARCPGAEGRAAMPARTNVNHATLLTGSHPQIHGVVGNAVWDRGRARARKLGAAADLLTETLFTVARRTRPDLRTAAALGKGKLALMFAAAGGQAAPQALWGPQRAPAPGREPVTGYAYDAATLEGVREIVADGTDFLLVNLADVDRVSHGAGPRSAAARQARRATDAALGDVLARLRVRDDWAQSTVVITADHGFDSVRHPALAFGALAAAAGLTDVVSVGDGGVEHVYVRGAVPSAVSEAQLAAARRLALATPGITEALYLVPNAADGGSTFTLGAVHPEWHLAHPRSGDLLLVGAPGYVFGDGGGDEAKLQGNHGGPRDTRVPVIVVRDGPRTAGDDCDAITAADLGRTIMSCLGLRDVERLDGTPIPAGGRGRILSGLCP